VPESLVPILNEGDRSDPKLDGGSVFIVFLTPAGKVTWNGTLATASPEGNDGEAERALGADPEPSVDAGMGETD